MAKFIIDTDVLKTELLLLTEDSRGEYLRYALREAHAENTLRTWLTPYEDKKKRGMSGTGPYSYLFESFWAAYPTRNGKKSGKRPAFKAWVKLFITTAEEGKLLDSCRVALEWQKRHEDWTKNNGTYIPMASTYLNAEGWTDEKPKEARQGKKIAKSY